MVDDVLPDLSVGEAKAAETASAVLAAAPAEGAGRWLVTGGPRAAPRLRLFCFPFAGGGSLPLERETQSNLNTRLDADAREAIPADGSAPSGDGRGAGRLPGGDRGAHPP